MRSSACVVSYVIALTFCLSFGQPVPPSKQALKIQRELNETIRNKGTSYVMPGGRFHEPCPSHPRAKNRDI